MLLDRAYCLFGTISRIENIIHYQLLNYPLDFNKFKQ